MPLWVDKYRPKTLEDVDYHKDQGLQLKKLADTGDIPHMLFYGPSGAGKKTRIMALLRDIFGPGVERVKLEHRSFKTPSGKAIEMTTVASIYHIEINPGDAGIYDRFVVQELIKEMAAYNPLSASETGVASKPWKVLILSEVDRLTKEAQAALRRTMERYTATCRLILVANSLSKVIEPVRSRCLGVRVAAPGQGDIINILRKIATDEKVSLQEQAAAKISVQSARNLRRAILMLETAAVANPGGITGTSTIPAMDWERYCALLALDILKEQSPKSLLQCRTRIYELLVNCIPSDVIIKRVVQYLIADPTSPGSAAVAAFGGAAVAAAGSGGPMPAAFAAVLSSAKVLTEDQKFEVVHWGAHYEHRAQLGSRELFHIEAFVAKAMSVIKMPTPPAVPLPGAAPAGAAAGGAGAAR